MSLQTHAGGCHCGKVRWEILAPENIQADECNCSICMYNRGFIRKQLKFKTKKKKKGTKKGFLHLIVPAKHFKLLTPRENLSIYTFNSGIAKHFFCSTCGICSFYVPRSNPDGFSINVRCLDSYSVKSVEIVPFDGKNWEKNAGTLAHKSKL